MTAPSVVRIARPEDHLEIWRLFLQGYSENGISSLAPEKVNWLINRCLNPDLIPLGDTGSRGVIGVIGPVGALEGVVFVTIGMHWYSYDKILQESIVLVDVEHRKSNHAHVLIQWMKDQSEITGLPLMAGIVSNHKTEAKCRLYRRMLPKIGEVYYYGPKGSNMPIALAASSS